MFSTDGPVSIHFFFSLKTSNHFYKIVDNCMLQLGAFTPTSVGLLVFQLVRLSVGWYICKLICLLASLSVHQILQKWSNPFWLSQKMCHSCCLISLATNMLEDYDIIHTLSGVQELFCTISRNQHISKTIWDMIFKEFEIIFF